MPARLELLLELADPPRACLGLLLRRRHATLELEGAGARVRAAEELGLEPGPVVLELVDPPEELLDPPRALERDSLRLVGAGGRRGEPRRLDHGGVARHERGDPLLERGHVVLALDRGRLHLRERARERVRSLLGRAGTVLRLAQRLRELALAHGPDRGELLALLLDRRARVGELARELGGPRLRVVELEAEVLAHGRPVDERVELEPLRLEPRHLIHERRHLDVGRPGARLGLVAGGARLLDVAAVVGNLGLDLLARPARDLLDLVLELGGALVPPAEIGLEGGELGAPFSEEGLEPGHLGPDRLGADLRVRRLLRRLAHLGEEVLLLLLRLGERGRRGGERLLEGCDLGRARALELLHLELEVDEARLVAREGVVDDAPQGGARDALDASRPDGGLGHGDGLACEDSLEVLLRVGTHSQSLSFGQVPWILQVKPAMNLPRSRHRSHSPRTPGAADPGSPRMLGSSA